MKIIKNSTLADQAYDALKEAITKGTLKEKETLPEERIAKMLGISRTPLRDALNRLSAEGLIVQETGKPAVVAGFNELSAIETLEVRGLLEVNNIEKIIFKIDDAFMNELKSNVEQQLVAIEKNKYDQFVDLDQEFHLALASKNSNSLYKDLVLKLNTNVNRSFLILSNSLPRSAKDAYEEHLDIIAALEKRDVTLAKNKMIIHMNNVEKRILKFYAEHKTNEDE